MTCLESCEPLFEDLGFLFFDFESWEGFFARIGRGSLSWIWIGKEFVLDLDWEGVLCLGFGLEGFALWKS